MYHCSVWHEVPETVWFHTQRHKARKYYEVYWRRWQVRPYYLSSPLLNSLNAGKFFMLFCRLLIFFFKINFSKISFRNAECQTVWIQIRPDAHRAWFGSKLFADNTSRKRVKRSYRGSYMSAHVLLNGKGDKMGSLTSILSLFCNKLNKFNNTGAWMLEC